MRLSRCIRPLASAMLVLVIALATMVTSAQSARAADPLTVFPACESTGGGNFFCDAFASGGTGSYSYSWSGPSTVWFSSTSGVITTGRCRPNQPTNVTVTVTDSAGNTASGTDYFWCYWIAP